MTEAPDSPTGRYSIRISSWEARMSLWIDTPDVVEADSQVVRLRFGDRHWSLDQATWTGEHQVRLVLRKYPGNRDPAGVTVVVDFAADLATLAGASPLPLSQLEAALDQELRRRPLARQGDLPG